MDFQQRILGLDLLRSLLQKLCKTPLLNNLKMLLRCLHTELIAQRHYPTSKIYKDSSLAPVALINTMTPQSNFGKERISFSLYFQNSFQRWGKSGREF